MRCYTLCTSPRKSTATLPNQKEMRVQIHSALKALTFMMVTTVAAHANETLEFLQTVQDALVASSSSDFAQHGPPVSGFRKTRIRYETLASGERSYLLCGEFRSSTGGNDGRWTHFATIKTYPYEQWIGGLAQAHCERAAAISDQPKDLSAVLQAHLEAVTTR